MTLDLNGTFSNEFGITMNYANPQVPEAECDNRGIKETVRATYHCLPYARVPWLIVPTIVTNSAKKLNFSQLSTASPNDPTSAKPEAL